MAGELNPAAQEQLLQTASVFEGALAVTAALQDVDMATLAGMHMTAAGNMLEAAEFAQIAGDTDPLGEYGRRATSYRLVMLAVENTVDRRNPDVQPPLSQRLRDAACERYGDRVEEQRLPDFPLQ